MNPTFILIFVPTATTFFVNKIEGAIDDDENYEDYEDAEDDEGYMGKLGDSEFRHISLPPNSTEVKERRLRKRYQIKSC